MSQALFTESQVSGKQQELGSGNRKLVVLEVGKQPLHISLRALEIKVPLNHLSCLKSSPRSSQCLVIPRENQNKYIPATSEEKTLGLRRVQSTAHHEYFPGLPHLIPRTPASPEALWIPCRNQNSRQDSRNPTNWLGSSATSLIHIQHKPVVPIPFFP